MRRRFCSLTQTLLPLSLLIVQTALVQTVRAQNVIQPGPYVLGPDSQYHEGVPRGEVTHATWTSKKIFPGTVRDYWVYVPKQYRASEPACIMFFQDGGGFQDVNGQNRVPVVFDNLIHKKEMPVTLAVMINPGVVPAASENALPRYNRSYEYDSLTDEYARFLLEEVLPELSKRYNITSDPAGRGLCGASSGGICAFTAAWERPDQFQRVISYVGSFTNLRGGHAYPSLIRKMEPKPLRIFMQDGAKDQDIYSGNWYIGNNDVAAALKFAGYQVQYVVGEGGHDGTQGGVLLPEALRWLWKDYPQPIAAGNGSRQPLMEILAAGEGWKTVALSSGTADGLVSDGQGNVYVSDSAASLLYKVSPEGAVSVFREKTDGAVLLTYGPDDRLYAAQKGKKRVVAYETSVNPASGKATGRKEAGGKETVVVTGVAASAAVVHPQQGLFVADARDGKLWRVDGKGRKTLADTLSPPASSLLLTPDQTLLLAGHATPGRFVTSYQIQKDGALAFKQPYADLHIPFASSETGAQGMTVDQKGWLYVTSLLGIQICDQASRVNMIIANPERLPTTGVVFGGPNQEVLYTLAGGKLYRRQTRAKGLTNLKQPLKPPGPRL